MTNSIVSSFVPFNKDGLELVVNTETGLAYASIRAMARMLETPESTIRLAVKGAQDFNVVNAQIQTNGGLQGAQLYPSDVVFKLALKYNLPLAEKMGAAGANVYMLGLAGYQVAIDRAVPKTYSEALLEAGRMAAEVERLELETKRQAEVIDELFDYSSIIRIAKYNNCDETSFKWQTLKRATKSLGLTVKSAPCPRYGTKNLYPHQAWAIAYPSAKLPSVTNAIVGAK